jgi:division protein CdvB (Snf7/Vps24/ESCRT-III family)
MASMRDAYKRLEIIYKATAPEAQEQSQAEAGLDEFTRLKKKVNQSIKEIRDALRDRDLSMKSGGTTTESAEASYKIRVMIKGVKESVNRMQEIYDKAARKVYLN